MTSRRVQRLEFSDHQRVVLLEDDADENDERYDSIMRTLNRILFAVTSMSIGLVLNMAYAMLHK